MKDQNLSVTEVFASPALPDREALQRAVAFWLTRELGKA